MNDESVVDLTINKLKSSDKYIIPIYQRNYAWTVEEVKLLLTDVWDMYNTSKDSNYYIGTLVVHQRPDGKFEVIDGQQRLTTLSIVLSALNNHKNINLQFESRQTSTDSLNSLFENGKCEEATMNTAYQVAKDFFSKDVGDDLVNYQNYLMGKVVVLRATVPAHTDLNHYFEIMNTRGEQLEKHEVLKANMMSVLTTPKEQGIFAAIWDACADMTRYVQMGFDAVVRGNIFDGSMNEIPDFTRMITSIDESGVAEDKKELSEILDNSEKSKIKTVRDGEFEVNARFDTVNIDFSNFLMHVLHIYKSSKSENNRDSYLDDKHIIEAFEDAKINNEDLVKKFAICLLKCRMLFDRYIIKRDVGGNDDPNWELSTLEFYPKDEKGRKSDSYGDKSTFGDTHEQKQLIILQSMFHVSFNAKNHKHWLNAALRYLNNATQPIDAKDYINFLERLSDNFFRGRHNKLEDTPKEYANLIDKTLEGKVITFELKEDSLNKGTHVNHYIFNYLDYLIWKNWPNNKMGLEGEQSEYDNHHKEFKFKIRSSVEHFSSQTPYGDEKKPIEHIDNFGNLSLISASSNSSLSNRDVIEKARKSPESMKQMIMYSYVNKYAKWGDEEVVNHGNIMIVLLNAGAVTP